MRTQDAIAQCDRRSGRSHTLTGVLSRVGADADLSPWSNIVTWDDLFCARSLFCDGVLHAEVFGAIEQFEQLAVLHAIDLVTGALDLGAADFVAGRLGLGFGIARGLPRGFFELGACLVTVGAGRLRDAERQRKQD